MAVAELTKPPMPLSTPTVSRERLHVRRISYEGFRRDDGLFDIDARLVDTKDQDFELLTGTRAAGEPVHDMLVRITVDSELTVRDVEAHTERMPYPGACDRIVGDYRKLIGANLLHGFRARLREALGGVRGCTHITELLGGVPTAAVQTFAGLRREAEGRHKPYQLDRCHALETTTDTVRTYYPKWYRGAA